MSSLLEFDPVAAVLDAKAGVARISQLRRLGLRLRVLNRKVAAGDWQWIGPSVVATQPGALTAGQREWATVAAAGPDAALCGLTAAARHGLKGFGDGRIHVLVPRGARPRRNPLPVAVHESRRYEPAIDRDDSRLLPMTRLERSVLDAAAWSRSPRRAAAIVAAAIAQGLTTPLALLDELDWAGQTTYHALLNRLLDDIAGGPKALGTIDLPRLCRQYGLPAPRHVTTRDDGDGRRRYLEGELTSKRGKSWLVEIDAAAHMIVGNYWRDDAPPKALIVTGESVLYVPSIDVYLNEIAVMTRLYQVLDD